MPMRKHTVFLITGLVLCAASIGFFRTTTYQRVEAASNKLSYDKDGKITLGSFPLNYDVKQSDLASNGQLDDYLNGQDPTITLQDVVLTTVNSVKYGMVHYTQINTDGGSSVGSAQLPSGATMIDAGGYRTGIFDFAPLKWVKYAEDGDYTDFISDYIVYRDTYHIGESIDGSYEKSSLCEHLNNDFMKIAFSDADKEYLTQKDVGSTKQYVDIPKLEVVGDTSTEPACSGPSDVAILSHISSKESFKNAPYWTQTKSDSRMSVRWYNKTVTDCLYGDNNIGVRPMIRIKSSLLGPYRGGSSSKRATSIDVNPAIPVGIIFGVLGVGVLVAFFILWSKKLKEDPAYKAPGWYYAIIFIAAACCSVSVITFSTQSTPGGGGGGASCFKTGYYVQDELYSGNGIAQVAYTAWLIKSDGTVSYSSRVEDNKSASDFAPDNYMTGTYTISGSKLTIVIPKHEIKNFGTVGGTFTFTIKGCENIQGSEGSYHWVRGE